MRECHVCVWKVWKVCKWLIFMIKPILYIMLRLRDVSECGCDYIEVLRRRVHYIFLTMVFISLGVGWYFVVNCVLVYVTLASVIYLFIVIRNLHHKYLHIITHQNILCKISSNTDLTTRFWWHFKGGPQNLKRMVYPEICHILVLFQILYYYILYYWFAAIRL